MEIVVSKAMKVFLREIGTDKVYYYGACTQNDINSSISEEELYDGQGALRAIISDGRKEEFTITNLFYNTDTDELVYGQKYVESEETVMEEEVVEIKSNSGELKGTPSGSTLLLINGDEKVTCAVASKTVTATDVPDGRYIVIYPTEKTVRKISIGDKSFPKNYYVELRGIGTDPKTEKTKCHIVRKYYNAKPDGASSRNYKQGNQTEQIKFKAQADETGRIGDKIIIPV